jgi:DNA-binding MarR family transcriptional regulator
MGDKITLDEYRLWVVFNQTYDLISKLDEEAYKNVGVTSQQYLVLWMMEYMKEVSDDPITITDLAFSLFRFRSLNSFSTIVNRMEKKGLVQKTVDPSDHRKIQLVMTPKGEMAFTDGLGPNRKFIKKMFSVYSHEEMKTLIFLIKKLKAIAIDECGIQEIRVDPESSSHDKIKEFLKRESK